MRRARTLLLAGLLLGPAAGLFLFRDAAASERPSVSVASAEPAVVRSQLRADGQTLLEAELAATLDAASASLARPAHGKARAEVNLEPAGEGRSRLVIVPPTRRLWGWRTRQEDGRLTITLREAPGASPPGTELVGLTVAVEVVPAPGSGDAHSDRSRAEFQALHRWAARTLAGELEDGGARLDLVHAADENPDTAERARRALLSEATILLSIQLGTDEQPPARPQATEAMNHGLAAALQQALQDQSLSRARAVARPGDGAAASRLTWIPSAVVVVDRAAALAAWDTAAPDGAAPGTLLARAIRQGLQAYLREPP